MLDAPSPTGPFDLSAHLQCVREGMEAGADDDLGGVRMIPAFSICFLLTHGMYFSFQDVTGSLQREPFERSGV